MKIRHYLYNAFIIEDGKTKIAIDPGLNLWIFKIGSLIPKSEWPTITHVLATHGDPDHYWNVDRVVKAAKAPLVCGKELVKKEDNKTFIADPRGKDIQFKTELENVQAISIGQTLNINGVKIEGLKAVHGPLVVRLFWGLLKFVLKPGPGERVGLGNIGFKITLGNKTLANLSDTVLMDDWKGLRPDVLMIPIGGKVPENTMDEKEALEAVKMIQPKLVIPCHYNCAFFWKKNYNPTDDQIFKREVEKLGIKCAIMKSGDEIEV
ncbi:MBL fold metallo-hydrolase [Candidatus Margulisiibacteriota bacterium]